MKAARTTDPVMRRASSCMTLSVLALVFLTAVAVYTNTLKTGFWLDDALVIASDSRVRDGELWRLVSEPYWPAAHGSRDALYRPLVSASFAVNWSLSPDPIGFRLVNLILHAGTSVVVCLWAFSIFDSLLVAAVAGLLFAVHPIHTEPLNLVVGRADLAMSLLGLLALLLAGKDAQAPHGSRTLPVAAALCFAGALLCKEQAVTIIGVALLVDAVSISTRAAASRGAWMIARLWRCYLPWLVLLVVYLGLRILVLGSLSRDPSTISIADNVLAHVERDLAPGQSVWLARWGTPVALFGKALTMSIWPLTLCHDYSYAAIVTVKELDDPRLLLGLAWLVGGGVVAICLARRHSRAVIPVLFFPIAYSVVSNAPVLIGTVFAERLLYLPSAGTCVLAGIVAATLWRGRLGREATGSSSRLGIRRALVAIITVAVILGCSARTVARNRQWQSLESLVAAAANAQPRSCRVRRLQAQVALRHKDYEQAIRLCRESLEITPDHALAYVVAGLAHYGLQENREALTMFQKGFQLGAVQNEGAICAAADLLIRFGDRRQARHLLATQLERYPMWSKARTMLGDLDRQ